MKNKEYISAEHPRGCFSCEHGRLSADRSIVLCIKRGPVPSDALCRKFVYDPLKRAPIGKVGIKSHEMKDFSLE